MEIKLPKKRADGSFCIEIALRVDTDDAKGLAAQMTSWLEEWTQKNRYWNWSEETLDFLQDFAGPPTCAERGRNCDACESGETCMRGARIGARRAGRWAVGRGRVCWLEEVNSAVNAETPRERS